MRVKLCTRCPYTPRDLADQYDAGATQYLCPACDLEHDRRKSLRRGTCQTIETSNTTGIIELRAAPFATEASASFAITAAAPPCAPKNASSISPAAARTTAAGYGDFGLPEDGGDRAATSTSADEVSAC
jgi:hypothetical protein